MQLAVPASRAVLPDTVDWAGGGERGGGGFGRPMSHPDTLLVLIPTRGESPWLGDAVASVSVLGSYAEYALADPAGLYLPGGTEGGPGAKAPSD